MTATASLPKEREIDGLRSVAVIPVLLYHSGLSGIPGGFVGVDIFFVISGYLITRLLAAEMAAGSFSLWQFYERRARRIAPALLVVTTATVLGALAIMVPQDLLRFGNSLVWAALFASNIFFAINTGYFSAPAESYPLLHTWSLAVEEQFYLLFPLLLWGLVSWMRRATIPVLAVLAAASLALCIIASPVQPTLSFYLPLTRSWELWLGALLALAQLPNLSRWLREIIAVAALAMIGWTVFALPPGTPFPGWIALLPTIGAALLIRYASGTLVGAALASAPLVAIGLISYSLYLWHWPLLSLASYWLMRPLTQVEGLGLIALAVPLSALTWFLVEQPFRNRQFLSRRTVLAATALSIALLAGTGQVLVAGDGLPQRLPAEAARLSAFADDYSPRRNDCHELRVRIDPDKACVLGGGVNPTMAVWGDSHGVELAYALGEIEGTAGRSVVQFTSSSCPPGLGYSPSFRSNCAAHNQLVLDHILAHPEIGTVVLTALTPSDDTADMDKTLHALDAGIAELRAAGRTVVLVYPVPMVSGSVPTRLARLYWRDGAFDAVAYPLASYQARLQRTLSTLDTIVAKSGAIAIRPAEYYCPDRDCLTYRDGEVLYFDFHHPTLSAARRLAKLVVDALPDAT